MATGSHFWSRTGRNGSFAASPPRRSAPSSPRSARFRRHASLLWALEHCGAVAMITLEAFRGRRFLDAVRVLCPELGDTQPGALKSARLPSLRTVVAVDGQAPAGVFSLPEFLAGAALADPESLAAAQRTVRADDICYMLYTSGSTAAPQCVP